MHLQVDRTVTFALPCLLRVQSLRARLLVSCTTVVWHPGYSTRQPRLHSRVPCVHANQPFTTRRKLADLGKWIRVWRQLPLPGVPICECVPLWTPDPFFDAFARSSVGLLGACLSFCFARHTSQKEGRTKRQDLIRAHERNVRTPLLASASPDSRYYESSCVLVRFLVHSIILRSATIIRRHDTCLRVPAFVASTLSLIERHRPKWIDVDGVCGLRPLPAPPPHPNKINVQSKPVSYL